MKQDVFPVGQGARKRRSQWLAFGIFKLLSYSIVLILFAILGFIIYKGIGVISWEFLTTAPSDGMTGGGIWPAIVGTFYLMAGSALFAFPVGVMSGIYMNEYAPKGKLVRFIRMMTNNLSGIPSIVFGLFGMALFVKYMGFGDSILAGSLTLGLLCVPLVIRTTEEALKAIPDSFREGSLALGATKLQTTIALFGKQTLYAENLPKNLMPRTLVGVGFTWNIFDGLNREANIRQTRLTKQTLQLGREKAQNELGVLVDKLYSEIQNAKDDVAALNTTIEMSRELVRIRKKSFQEGMATSTDVIDAETMLSKVQIAFLLAYYKYDVALASLLSTCGMPESFWQYSRTGQTENFIFGK